MKNRYIHNQSGMSIIELLVALGVFSIFIAMAVSGFIQAISSQKLALLLMEANDTASLAIEQMSREIRTAEGGTISTGGNSITFDTDRGTTVTYSIQGGALLRDGERITSSTPNIRISHFETEKINSAVGGAPPRIVIWINTTVSYKNMNPITTYLQTSITPRIYYGNL